MKAKQRKTRRKKHYKTNFKFIKVIKTCLKQKQKKMS